MDEYITKFHDEHEVEYQLQVVVDGVVVVKYTDGQSFDAVSGYASIADQAMQQHITAEVTGQEELDNQAAEDELRDREA